MKKQLPYDYARCQPNAQPCHAKTKCARFTSEWNPNGVQSCFDGSIDSELPCEMFISNEVKDSE